MPDLAIQMVPCLEQLSGFNLPAFDADAIQAIFDAIRAEVGTTNADIRYACAGEIGRIGIWLRPTSGIEDTTARDRGMANLDLLPGSAAPMSYALFVSARLLRRVSGQAFQAAPKRYNVAGEPDPGGRIHVTGMSLHFQTEPAAVLSLVNGFYDGPLKNSNFLITISDRLSASANEVKCLTTVELDISDTALRQHFGVSLLHALASPLFLAPGLLALRGLFAVDLHDYDHATANDETIRGVGQVVSRMFPAEIMILDGRKLVLFYGNLGALDEISVTTGGVTTRGIAFPADRVPGVTISGHSSIITKPDIVTNDYRLTTRDLRSPLRVQWTASNGTVLHPTRRATSLRLDLTDAQPDQVITSRLEVTVTDADSLIARASKEIAIQVADGHQPDEGRDERGRREDPIMPQQSTTK